MRRSREGFREGKYAVGYLTGTFDTFHQAHIDFLRHAKSLCHILIVGVTTDEVAVRQKRKPLFDFAHRLAVVETCRYVDSAVAHEGLSKQEDWRRIRFDVLISGAEYVDSKEFAEYECTPVVFLPRGLGYSSTDISARMRLRTITEDVSVLCQGVNGLLLLVGTEIVIKEMRIGREELGTTGDVHDLGFPRPRNWKRRGAVHMHPNLPGVNPNREVAAARLVKGKPWSPVLEVVQKWSNPVQEGDLAEVWWIVQRYGGPTLAESWDLVPQVSPKIEAVAKELGEMHLVHGDIHPSNVCVDRKTGRVSVIDFGWCTHSSFEMSPEERKEHEANLLEHFDLRHYRESLEWFEFKFSKSSNSSNKNKNEKNDKKEKKNKTPF